MRSRHPDGTPLAVLESVLCLVHHTLFQTLFIGTLRALMVVTSVTRGIATERILTAVLRKICGNMESHSFR